MMIVKVVCVLIAVFMVVGCNGVSMPFSSPNTAQQQAAEKAASDKFTGPENKPATAVESALILSDKYAKAADQLSQEQAKNIELNSDNEKLKAQAASLQSQLDQTQKELGEANQLLVELQKELNNWKIDVIGFREEMRKANQSQLEALTRIMLILGAETPTPDANTTAEPNSK